ncbi:AAA family ATPase [Neptuniibacter sp. PT34_22]|uniref:AAA family ATPase n=1 Tax=Neptuniibacter sp. PT34_22 TaxID=3398205 RepID=UPI0039F53D2D
MDNEPSYRLVYLKIDCYKNIINRTVRFTLDYEVEENSRTKELIIKESAFYLSKTKNRNPLAHLDVFTAFVGENGSGKSNLIELISYLFTTGMFPKGLVDANSRSYAIVEQTISGDRSFLLVTPNVEYYSNEFENTARIAFCSHLDNYEFGKTILYHPLNDLSAGTSSNVVFNSEKIASNPFKKLSLGTPDSRLAKKFADNALSLTKFNAFKHIADNEFSRLVLLFSDFKSAILEDKSFSEQFSIFSKRTAQVKLYKKLLAQLDEETQTESIFVFLYSFFMTLSAVQHNKRYTDVPYLVALMVASSIFSDEIPFIKPFHDELEKYVKNQQWEGFRDEVREHIMEFKESMSFFDVEHNELNGSHLSVNLLEVRSENKVLDLICSNDWFDLNAQKRAFRGANIPLKIDGLSSGEISAIHYLSELYRKVEEYGQSALVVLDEPENSFHPEWQRLLISILDDIYRELRVSPQTIISSHSPFILSDTLSGKVLFLGDHPGLDNCFAANIHDLLSHGFFLKQTIGNASQIELSKVVDFINEPISEVKNRDDTSARLEMSKLVIEQVGDYVLKRELKRKLSKLEISLSPSAVEFSTLLTQSGNNPALNNELRELAIKYSISEVGDV